MRRHVRSGNPHDEAQIRDEPVISAKHRGAQGIPAHTAMPALETRQGGAGKRISGRTGQGPDDPRMRTLRRRKTPRHCLGLRRIGAAVDLL